MQRLEDIYIDFASKISFLEFIQDEFRDAKVPVEELKQEISLLESKKQWNINDLSDYVKNYPRSFIIFQQIFQLLRFTNAQLIHFVFDTVKLNSLDINAIYEYMILNLKYDLEFRKMYLKTINRGLKFDEFIGNMEQYDRKYLIATFKLAISKYIDKIIKDFSILESRITKSEFEDFSIRFSNYLLNNLGLNEMLGGINIERYLRNKRIPLDAKSLHGNYPRIKIVKILEVNGYKNIDYILSKAGIHTLKLDLQRQIGPSVLGNDKIFCTERYIEGIIKTRDNKPKKFDLIIFSGHKPKYLFEMNFYSTEGTKIGINQNEYIDLNNYIKSNFSDFKFYWITDGNYWLTTQGKTRFLNLLNHFDKIFNINIFTERVNDF
ncbi:type II restriction endonuclease [candidate division WOR-3 bacterium]|nr:type II restriction endonuclease [candidate division WOR-3 bacterium]